MKVLLLGARGQLGRAIVRANESSGGQFELIAPERRQLDLANTGSIWRKLQEVDFDTVVNCTGFHDVDEVETQPGVAFTVNAYSVQELARVCEHKHVSLIHFSTDYVFGGDATRSVPLTECSPTAPVNIYGASKLMGESLANLDCNNVAILRVATLFGVGGMSGSGSNFVEAVLRKGRQADEFRVVNDQTMSPTSATDIASAFLQLLRNECEPGIYHAVNTGLATRYEFAREILRQAKLPDVVQPCTSEEFPTPARRPQYSALDNRKLCSNISVMPTWQDALCRYLRERSAS